MNLEHGCPQVSKENSVVGGKVTIYAQALLLEPLFFFLTLFFSLFLSFSLSFIYTHSVSNARKNSKVTLFHSMEMRRNTNHTEKYLIKVLLYFWILKKIYKDK